MEKLIKRHEIRYIRSKVAKVTGSYIFSDGGDYLYLAQKIPNPGKEVLVSPNSRKKTMAGNENLEYRFDPKKAPDKISPWIRRRRLQKQP